MIVFFRTAARHVIAVETSQPFTEETANRLKWLSETQKCSILLRLTNDL